MRVLTFKAMSTPLKSCAPFDHGCSDEAYLPNIPSCVTPSLSYNDSCLCNRVLEAQKAANAQAKWSCSFRIVRSESKLCRLMKVCTIIDGIYCVSVISFFPAPATCFMFLFVCVQYSYFWSLMWTKENNGHLAHLASCKNTKCRCSILFTLSKLQKGGGEDAGFGLVRPSVCLYVSVSDYFLAISFFFSSSRNRLLNCK